MHNDEGPEPTAKEEPEREEPVQLTRREKRELMSVGKTGKTNAPNVGKIKIPHRAVRNR